jgi:glucan phosphoethanolaminetransferase (alkaline phosphatase superfamily)
MIIKMNKFGVEEKKDIILLVLKIIAVLIVIVGGVVHYDFIARIQYLKFYSGYFGVSVFLLIWIFSIIGLFACAFIPKPIIRFTLAGIVFISTWVGIAYISISGTPITYDSLYVLLENYSLANGAVNQYTFDIVLGLLIASSSFLFFLPNPVFIKKYFSEKKQKITLYALPIIPFIMCLALAVSRGGYGLEQTPIQYNIPTLLALMESENLFLHKNIRNDVNYAHLDNNTSGRTNVVLIVDESIRGDYLDLYTGDMGLTPYLFSKRERIINFGYACSGANLSAESNQILRYGPNITNFATTFKSNPYIWEYAKKAGYRTILLEGQARKGQLNDRISKDELKYIDTLIYIEGKEGYEKDSKIAKFIAENVSSSNSKPLFIYAVKFGLHFPYDEHVPMDKKKYHSGSKGFEEITKSDLVNAYKNGICYLIDSFFQIILENRTYKNSIIIYTSDHGQNLLDNGQRNTHGSVENASPYEGLVPLFVITDNEIFRRKFEEAASRNFNKASHFNIFSTELTFMGYDKKEFAKYHGKSLLDDIQEPRKFNSGLLSINRIGLGKRNNNKWNFLPDSIIANPYIIKKTGLKIK